MKPGDTLEVRGLHADGQAYRWWPATIESAAGSQIVVTWPPGTAMRAPTSERERVTRRRARGYYWLDRPYAIVEAYDATGALAGISADLCSPARLEDGRIVYIDYELDVVKFPGRPAFVEDEEEFLQAAERYGYTVPFQQQCRRTVEELLTIVESWKAAGPPRLP